jgi:hypothetical protein
LSTNINYSSFRSISGDFLEKRKDMKLLHGKIPSKGIAYRCQFCGRFASEMIRDFDEKPVILMCKEHTLYFIRSLLEDITTDSAAVTKLIKERQEEQSAESQAWHV